jgi:MFS family permease
MRNPLVQTRDGRLLLAAQLIDALGNGLASVALPWLVLDGGGSKSLAGLVFAATMVPYVVFGLPAGVTGDRHPRRWLMRTAHTGQAVAAALVPLYALGSHPPSALVLFSAFAIGAGRVYADAAAFGAIAELVGPASFVQGQAALSTAWAIGLVAGPVAGGALVAAIGPAAAITVESIGFVVAAVLVSRISQPLLAHDVPEGETLRDAVREGVGVIWHTPALRLLTLVVLAWNLSIVGAEALSVPFLREGLKLDAGQAGIILAAGGVTGVFVGPFIGAAVERIGGLRLISASIPISGVASIGLALAPGFAAALPAFVLLSFSFWVAVTTMIGERQRIAPPHLQSRVGITGRMISVSSMTVASLVASALVSVVPLRGLYLGFGVAALCVAAWAVPALYRVQSPVPLVEPEPAGAD